MLSVAIFSRNVYMQTDVKRRIVLRLLSHLVPRDILIESTHAHAIVGHTFSTIIFI